VNTADSFGCESPSCGENVDKAHAQEQEANNMTFIMLEQFGLIFYSKRQHQKAGIVVRFTGLIIYYLDEKFLHFQPLQLIDFRYPGS
jgi:hypothetical protein